MQPISITQQNDIVGEGAIWHPSEQKVYWIDILKPALYSYDPATKHIQNWIMPDVIGSIAVCQSGKLLGVFRHGIGFIDLPSANVSSITSLIPSNENVRFNDSAVDANGRLWVGSMDLDEKTPKGKLFCYTLKEGLKEMADDYVVANGMDWSLDHKTLYHADSGKNIIFRYDFDLASGTISHRQEFYPVPAECGFCDGLCVDNEGFIWFAHWSGWRVTRLTPEASIDRVIELPTQSPTTCCFGNKDLQTLYIPSAALNLTKDELAHQPQAGNLFTIPVDVKGKKVNLFKD